MMPMPSVEGRFWSKVRKSDGCWEWTGARGHFGHGRFSAQPQLPRREQAHRYSWMLANGPIPDGLFVCHNCPGGDNPACVNPAHLFLGTQADNMRDMYHKGSGRKRTHCKRGHPLEGDNLKIRRQVNGDIQRRCRICLCLKQRATRARKRACRIAWQGYGHDTPVGSFNP